MVEIKVPITRYDFFAVIIPGLVMLFSGLTFFIKNLISSLNSLFQDYANLTSLLVIILSIGFLGLSYLLGLVNSLLSSLFFEHWIIKKKLKYPSSNFFSTPAENKISKWFRKYKKSYSTEFQEDFKRLFKQEIKRDFDIDSENFSLIHAFIQDNSDVTYSRLANFLSLYGLFRNLAFALLMSFSFLVITVFVSEFYWLILLGVLCILLSYFSFLGYLKYYRIFGDECFKSFYICALKKKERKLDNEL